MPVSIPTWRNAVYFQPVIRHSSKIYEFFGVTPSATTSPSTTNRSGSSRSRMLPIQQTTPRSEEASTTTTFSPNAMYRPPSRASCCTAMSDGRGAAGSDRRDMISPLPAGNGNANRRVVYVDGPSGESYVEEGTQTKERPSPPTARGPNIGNAAAAGAAEESTREETLLDSLAGFTKRLVQACTPVWFSMPASLAFVALILRLLPSTLSISFPGLVTISTVLFLVALAGYAVTSVLFLARLLSPPNIRLRHRSLPLIERDSIKLGFVQYCPAGLALSAAAFGSFAVAEGRVPDRKGWAMAVYVCWWVSAALMAFLGFFTLAVYMSHSTVLVRSKTAHGRGLPLVAVLEGVTGGATVALVGAVMCLPGAGVVAGFEGRERIVSDGMAAPVVVFSYCVVGAVLLLALMAYAVVVHELLLVTGWPPPELTSVMFYLVGPLGQCAAALLVLGEAAGTGHYLGDLYRGNRSSPGLGIGVGIGEEEDMIRRKVSPLSPPLPAVPIGVISLLFAMMLFGMAVMWLVLALIAVGYRLHRGELVWNESWNGAIFPLLTLAVCSSWLSFELQSGFFRILTCVLIIICLVKFLVIVAFNARLAVSSSVFRPSRQ